MNSASYGRDNPISNKDVSGNGPELLVPIAGSAAFIGTFYLESMHVLYENIRNNRAPSPDQFDKPFNDAVDNAAIAASAATGVLLTPVAGLTPSAILVARAAAGAATTFNASQAVDLLRNRGIDYVKASTDAIGSTAGEYMGSVPGRYPMPGSSKKQC
jgi:hypothetical protein